MTDLSHPGIQALLRQANHAVVSTRNEDGTILGNVVWIDGDEGVVRVNSAVGRRWPTNLQRDPHVDIVLLNQQNPYEFAEIAGEAEASIDGADEHIDGLAKKYLNQDSYPFRQPGEQRIMFTIRPTRVRYVKQ